MSDDVVIRCEDVYKCYCRDLRTSLWYGVKDITTDILATVVPSFQRGRLDPCSGEHLLRRGEFWANRDINFELKAGECLGLIGHNGAGKTTLLKLLNGLIKPDAGNIAIRGTVGALIALGAGFNPILTGRENIYINSAVLGRSKTETDRCLPAIVEFADLQESVDSPVQNYSSGMKVRLGFAIATQMRPQVLLVDEVLAVGDSNFQKKCYDRIYEMKHQGTSFIIVSHNPYQLERLCDRVAVMSVGEILSLTAPKEAIHRYHMELQKDGPGSMKQSHRHQGTGQALIEDVFLTDVAGNRIQQVETGMSISLHANCHFHQQLSNLRIRFCIYSESGTLVANIGSVGHSEQQVFREGCAHWSFAVPRVDLLAGAYSVEVVLVSDRGLHIDRVMDAVQFNVITRDHEILNQTAAVGILHINGSWTIGSDR